MVRGKYAAKANGQRAEAAQNTASALHARLDEERRDRAAEVAALKAQIGRLQGRLTSEVKDLAAQAVLDAQTSCAEKLKAERADRTAAGDAVIALLTEHGFRPSPAVWAQLYALLELDQASSAAGDRHMRRLNAKKMRPIATRHEQELDRAQRGRSMHRELGPGSLTPEDLRTAADEIERRNGGLSDSEVLEMLESMQDARAARREG